MSSRAPTPTAPDRLLLAAGRSALTPKARETRARILDAAVALCAERGFQRATMRAIAARAGVSLGNAYYYFPSKEHLIQGFYARTHQEHLVACEEVLARSDTLKARLLGVLHARIDTIEPYHEFSGVLFRTAADPRSPLNPFSEESGPVRDEAVGVFRQVLRGTRTRVPDEFQAALPVLLWTYHMGVVLFWIHDESPGRHRTRQLVDHSVELIVRLLAASRLPGLGRVRRAALRMLEDILPLPLTIPPTQSEKP